MALTKISGDVIQQPFNISGVSIGIGNTLSDTSNTVIGAGAATSITGSSNTFIGSGVGRSVTTAYRNTAIGYQAMYNNDIGPTNTAIGYQALYSLSGYTYYNTAVGRYALGALTSGISNIAMGHNSGSSVTTGGGNICIGSGGPINGNYNVMIAGAGSTAGSYNILLGGSISATTGTESYNVILGGVTAAGGINNNIIIGDGQGNERLRINSSGNVGIGTTNPIGVFHTRITTDRNLIFNTSIGGDARITALNDAANANVNFVLQGTDVILQSTGGSLKVASSGNVGIGTTNPVVSLDLKSKTDAIALPQGTTTQRPSGNNPYIRYNTTNTALEFYNGTDWVEIISDYFPSGSTILG